jgi:hypothetical protein
MNLRRGRSAELFALEGADLGNIAFDDELEQCRVISP